LNSGSTWSDYNNAPTGGFVYIHIAANDDFDKFVLTGRDYSYFVTVIGGVATFTTKAMVANDYFAVCGDSTLSKVYIGGYYFPKSVYVTTDDGATFTEVFGPGTDAWYSSSGSSDGTFAIFTNLDNPNVATTFDGGATWSMQITNENYITTKTIRSDSTGVNGIYRGDDNKAYLFVATEPLPFTVDSITPSIGTTAGGTPVTIVGTGFDPAATAAIDGNDLTDLVVVDDTTITGVTPAGTVGVVDVTVTNP
jgi:hypothetical protein